MSANERITNPDWIVFKIDGIEIAKFEDNGNGMDGFISEGNTGPDPGCLEASDLCALAAWILTKAEQRAQDNECK